MNKNLFSEYILHQSYFLQDSYSTKSISGTTRELGDRSPQLTPPPPKPFRPPPSPKKNVLMKLTTNY